MARGRRRGGKKIDFLRWIGANDTFDAQSAGSAAKNFFSQTLPLTIMRTRGELICYVDGVSAPGALVEIGVGLIVVPEGSSTTVTVSPLTDPEADWFYYSRFHIGYEEMVTDVIAVQTIQGYREVVDNKAMRRMGSTEEVQVVVENITRQTAEAVNISLGLRLLLGT